MSKFFSADLHVGEIPAPGNPSYYRGFSPEELQRHFLAQCHAQIGINDELYLLGDLITDAKYLQFYDQLPDCRLFIICGNKEQHIENFADEAFKRLPNHRNRLEVFTGFQFVGIGGRTWHIAHRPKDVIGFSVPMPALCAHAHGFWRTRQLSNGEPLINVGIDAWCGNIVSEKIIQLQYEGVTSGKFNHILNLENL